MDRYIYILENSFRVRDWHTFQKMLSIRNQSEGIVYDRVKYEYVNIIYDLMRAK